MKVIIAGYIVADDEKWIYEYFGLKATSPADIAAAIEEAKGGPLDVEITTCYGGDVWSGSEIYTALKAYAGGVNIKITGLAASAASIIAEAAHCEMSPTAEMFVHNVQGSADGDYHEMDKSSGILKNANKALASAYMLKSGMSEKDALEMMENETWLTAQQALDKGLIDGIMFNTSGVRLAASFGGMGLPQEVIEKMRGMFKDGKIPESGQPEVPEADEKDPSEAEPEQPPAPENNLATEIDKMKLALQAQL